MKTEDYVILVICAQPKTELQLKQFVYAETRQLENGDLVGIKRADGSECYDVFAANEIEGTVGYTKTLAT